MRARRTDELDRDTIKNAVRDAVEPQPYVIALWEGGSAAWGREDIWSDIDLQLLVADGFTADAIRAVDEALRSLCPIDIRYEVPQPAWHGHEQVFYRLRDAGEFRLVDLAVMRRSSLNQLRERERHGMPGIIFDKTGEARPTNLDQAEHRRRVAERFRQLTLTFPLFQSLVKKELLRGNSFGAISFYYSHTIQPLVTLLRIRHCPDRFDFGPRYTAIDLPSDVVLRIEPLWLLGDLEEIRLKQVQAEAYFEEILEEFRSSGLWAELAGTPELE